LPGSGATTGVITVTGNYTQFASGVLAVSIGGVTAGTQFDQLAVGGAAAFGGTFTAGLVNGFTPAPRNRFPVITFASRSGEFGTYTGLTFGTGLTFRTAFEAADLALFAAASDIRVSPTLGLITSKAGDRATFSVVLSGTKPTGNVTVSLSSSN